MTIKTVPFDMASELSSEEAITEYLRQVFEDGNSNEIVRAIGHVARAQGMAQLAKDSGLGLENLYIVLYINKTTSDIHTAFLCRSQPVRHSREGGNPERWSRWTHRLRNLARLESERVYWIPASAGMTSD